VLLAKDHADEADHGGSVREDPDDVGATSDLLVQPLLRVDAPMSSGSLTRRPRGEALDDDREELSSDVALEDLVEDDAVVFSFNDRQAVVRTPLPRTLLRRCP
jgi:hypothetical protein